MMGVLSPYSVNWQTPVERNHHLNRRLLSWWLNVPHWQGGTLLRDLCGRHHGTLTGMEPADDWKISTTRPGGWGALSLDGSTDYVTWGDVSQFDFGTGPFSICAWVNVSVSAVSGNLLGKDDWSSGASGIMIYTTAAATTELRYYSGAARVIGPIRGTGWRHIAASRQRDLTTRLYVDGLPVLSFTDSRNLTNSHAFAMGVDGDLNQFGPASEMDDIRIWNRGLTSAEVMKIYRLSKQGNPGVLTPIIDRNHFFVSQEIISSAANRNMALMGVGR